ncbi:MAG: erythromycin esterase family protein [Actinomycetota bacterium]|nr:erythromycin esterase family protein [Actinomycetota bacterium]
MQDLERLDGPESEYDGLLDCISSTRFVLVVEATLGNDEFYQERVQITKPSDVEQGFVEVGVETDWPTAFPVNWYLLGMCAGNTAPEAQDHSAELKFVTPCQGEVVAHQMDLNDRAGELVVRNVWLTKDENFLGEKTARPVLNAEHYFRMIYRSNNSPWNPCDRHMVETLRALATHLEKRLDRTGIVVRERNSHFGVARVTSSRDIGEPNAGHLVREFLPGGSGVVILATGHVLVTTVSNWGGAPEHKRVRPALEWSYNRGFNFDGIYRAIVPTLRNAQELYRPLVEQGIGNEDKAETELASRWYRAVHRNEFDAAVRIDQSILATPQELTSLWDDGEGPDIHPMEF